MAANPADMPNFEEVAQASQTIVDNFRRFSNLPAVEGGAAIIGLIQALQQGQQQQTQQMRQIQQNQQQQMQQMQQMQQSQQQQMQQMQQMQESQQQQMQQMQQMQQSLQQQMQQMQQSQQQQMQQMQQQLLDMEQRLATRISACNTNVLSRLHNSKIFAPNQPLAPLRHVVTNTAIDGFPTTSAAIAILPQANANDLLAALGEDVEGNIAAKRQRVRRAIGLLEIAA
ncbi:hypothetical protein K431DRAFT_346844 [Polychaeton citri CBS 116435]|uniref:Uncharacterized protein n=1 Tax=Polychaeton citri CBS 116435 TaxID=1314669 RepID=A0A9P4UQ68_9PEZI|nr:hypothetical protein K431DRAFT_346844 [Polychaeton citri CBS 116435]